jgi:hypothetical protein
MTSLVGDFEEESESEVRMKKAVAAFVDGLQARLNDRAILYY